MRNLNEIKNNFRVVLASSLELAKTVAADATVEAEYGDTTVAGTKFTLAHHGVNSHNPAPCNWRENVALDGGTILVSHIDLDTLGGVFKVMGIHPKHDEFWAAAEFIDCNGRHHLPELDSEMVDLLNAYYAWVEGGKALPVPRTPFGQEAQLHDVMDNVIEAAEFLIQLLQGDNAHLIEEGRVYASTLQEKQEALLVFENSYMRVFQAPDFSVNLNSAYYSSTLGTSARCNIIYRENLGNFTVGFFDVKADGANACEIMQRVFGPNAGGHVGIAGSPRGVRFDGKEKEEKLKALVEELKNIYEKR